MKVYVLFIEQVVDYEVIGQDVKVYANKQKALSEFSEFVSDEKMFVARDEWTILNDKEDLFEAYEEGSYACNHSIAEVICTDVID